MTDVTAGPAAPVAPAAPSIAELRAESPAGPVGDRGASLRRKVAYAFLIAYALLMFVPFAWTLVTSFKTIPDSVQLSFFPDPFTLAGWEAAWTELNPPLPTLFFNSFLLAGSVMITNL